MGKPEELDRIAKLEEQYRQDLADGIKERRRLKINWRQALVEIQRRRKPIYRGGWRNDRLRIEMEIACNAFHAWESAFPARSHCPLVAAWRMCAVAKFNDWSREQARKENAYFHWEMPALEPHKMRFSRRPTLSEYDSRRDVVICDRYRFGIYAGQYGN